MARVMREELCTMIRVRGNIGVLVAIAGLLVACAGGSSQWQRERLTALPKAGDRILGERLIDAQYVVAGFFFQAEDGIRDLYVTGVQTCALPISARHRSAV